MKYIISRAYVEFGPFESEEVLGFGRRGLLRDGDYVRTDGDPHWEPWEAWAFHHGDSAPASGPTPTPAKKVPAAKKSAPAKKAPAAKKTAAKKKQAGT
jgi:hypothetical protein